MNERIHRAIGISIAAGVLSACGPAAEPGSTRVGALGTQTDAEEIAARVELAPTAGFDARGTVSFVRAGAGVELRVAMTGLAPGPHGMHIHERGDCSAPDASSAGDHFNPDGRPHGGRGAPAAERHPGDLGNITASEAGVVEQIIEADSLVVDGRFAMLGKALVVHEAEDDERSQPSGNSGKPAACGVIRAGRAGGIG